MIKWLKSQKYGYFLEDGKTWVNYGDFNDTFPYKEENKVWELSRNRFIDKTINVLEYEDIDEITSDLNYDGENMHMDKEYPMSNKKEK